MPAVLNWSLNSTHDKSETSVMSYTWIFCDKSKLIETSWNFCFVGGLETNRRINLRVAIKIKTKPSPNQFSLVLFCDELANVKMRDSNWPFFMPSFLTVFQHDRRVNVNMIGKTRKKMFQNFWKGEKFVTDEGVTDSFRWLFTGNEINEYSIVRNGFYSSCG